MRILIVDDEEHLRRMMRLTLETAGREVADAASGEEGLRLFGDGYRFDVTLLDQRMPGMDGLETLRRMRLLRADAAIIMVTAYATIELAVDAMKLGATDFVRKPMTPDTLRHAVDAALAKRSGLPAPAAPPESRADQSAAVSPPETWTTNGFFIRRVVPAAGPSGDQPTEHRFVVTRGKEPVGSEVVVAIDPATAKRVSLECRRDLSPSGAFWRRQAETALMNYLWSEAALPDGGRLVIDRATGPMLDAATRWDED